MKAIATLLQTRQHGLRVGRPFGGLARGHEHTVGARHSKAILALIGNSGIDILHAEDRLHAGLGPRERRLWMLMKGEMAILDLECIHFAHED